MTKQLTVQNAAADRELHDLRRPRRRAARRSPSTPQPTDFDGTIASYQWNFGDGTTASGQNATHAYAANTALGAKTVTLTVTDSANQTTVVTRQVTVQNAPPSPVFSVSDSTPDVGQAVTFNGSASSDFEGPIADTNHDWDLDGNGSFESTGKTPSRSYSTPGPVTVRLQVTDSNGATETASQTITVNDNAPPTAVVTVSHVDQPGGAPGVVNIGETVTFDGSQSTAGEPSDTITKYEWDLDGNPGTGPGGFESTGETPSRSYSTPGPVTVTLRVTDSNGGTDTEPKTITVTNAPPTAAVTVSHVDLEDGAPGVADVGETVNFNGTASKAGESSDIISKYEWDLDGNASTGPGGFEVNTGTTPTTSRAYSAPGPVTVRLRVTDSAGSTNVASTPSLRFNAPPVARIGILNAQAETGQKRAIPLAGQPFEFTAGAITASSGAPPAPGCPANTGTPASPASGDPEGPITYRWELDGDNDFNDGTTQNVPSPPEGYPAGPRTVKLRVIDSAGASHTATLTFRVNTPPTPGFVLEPVTPVIGEGVTFSTTSGDPDAAESNQLTHSWDLDADGTYCEAGEQGTSVTTIFSTPGFHTIKLRVTDPGGITREVTREVLVHNTIPTGSIAFSPEAPVPGQSVTFDGSASSPTGKTIAPLEWHFDFDAAGFDPATDEFVAQATGASVVRSFATAGPRTVALKISEVGGGFRIVTRTIVINAPPQANFSISDQSPFTGVPVTLSSISQDPDGPLASQQWDLDDDGAVRRRRRRGRLRHLRDARLPHREAARDRLEGGELHRGQRGDRARRAAAATAAPAAPATPARATGAHPGRGDQDQGERAGRVHQGEAAARASAPRCECPGSLSWQVLPKEGVAGVAAVHGTAAALQAARTQDAFGHADHRASHQAGFRRQGDDLQHAQESGAQARGSLPATGREDPHVLSRVVRQAPDRPRVASAAG